MPAGLTCWVCSLGLLANARLDLVNGTVTEVVNGLVDPVQGQGDAGVTGQIHDGAAFAAGLRDSCQNQFTQDLIAAAAPGPEQPGQSH